MFCIFWQPKTSSSLPLIDLFIIHVFQTNNDLVLSFSLLFYVVAINSSALLSSSLLHPMSSRLSRISSNSLMMWIRHSSSFGVGRNSNPLMAVCDKASIVAMLHSSMMVRRLKPVVLRQSVLNKSNACLSTFFFEENLLTYLLTYFFFPLVVVSVLFLLKIIYMQSLTFLLHSGLGFQNRSPAYS